MTESRPNYGSCSREATTRRGQLSVARFCHCLPPVPSRDAPALRFAGGLLRAVRRHCARGLSHADRSHQTQPPLRPHPGLLGLARPGSGRKRVVLQGHRLRPKLLPFPTSARPVQRHQFLLQGEVRAVRRLPRRGRATGWRVLGAGPTRGLRTRWGLPRDSRAMRAGDFRLMERTEVFPRKTTRTRTCRRRDGADSSCLKTRQDPVGRRRDHGVDRPVTKLLGIYFWGVAVERAGARTGGGGKGDLD